MFLVAIIVKKWFSIVIIILIILIINNINTNPKIIERCTVESEEKQPNAEWEKLLVFIFMSSWV